ncbi:transposase [uncultured Alsobacter sp.]|uniref:transposase n=1 Tax=uncultured Alsobacter sp. TaxID=1748258 RepID=UPI0025F6EFD1|nr:transposase [uncultured Alsobacter sp.]
MTLIDQSCFWDEDSAVRVLVATRWPRGVQCPCCGELGRVKPIAGKTTASGSFKCYACKRRFSVRTGSLAEGSHIPLSRWLRAILVVACAGRPFGCKHLEEACDVAPRIARALRQKLLLCLQAPQDPPGMALDDLPVGLLLGDSEVAHEFEPFQDVCRALGIPSEDQAMTFLTAVRRVIASPPSTSAVAASGGSGDVDLGNPAETREARRAAPPVAHWM